MTKKRLLNLQECKDIQLEILAEIDAFCRKNDIRYSLCGGTLIGAIRHKGFIPWDDDIDLLMPRPDYEIFRKTFHSESTYVDDLALRNDCIETFLKVCKKGTVMVDKNFGRVLWGVNVDVFPIDGGPEKEIDSYYRQVDATREKLMKICPFYRTVSGFRRFPLFLKYCLKRVVYFYPGTFASLKRKITDIQKSIDYEASSVVGVYYWVEKERTFLPKPVYEELTFVPFEGKEYPATAHYDFYLRQMYGDYMQLPPVEKRVTHHAYDAYLEFD